MSEKNTESVNPRMEALRRYDILDTPAERAFDDLTRLASYICKAPIALITLLDDHRQWFKSRIGLGVSETPIEQAFCAHAIKLTDVMIVTDATADTRFASNPLVTRDPHIRFYAGAPLVTPEGVALGTLCTLDRVPRELDAGQREALTMLSRQVVAQLELRRTVSELMQALEEKNVALADVDDLQGLLPICAHCRKMRDGEDYWHHVDHYFAKHSALRFTHGICPPCFAKIMAEIEALPPPDVAAAKQTPPAGCDA